MSTEEEPRPDDSCLWSDAPSDKLLYEVTIEFSDEEGENEKNIRQLLAFLLHASDVSSQHELPH